MCMPFSGGQRLALTGQIDGQLLIGCVKQLLDASLLQLGEEFGQDGVGVGGAAHQLEAILTIHIGQGGSLARPPRLPTRRGGPLPVYAVLPLQNCKSYENNLEQACISAR